MKHLSLLLILALTIGAMSCKEDPKLPLENAEDSISTFYFIRPVSYTHLTLPTTPYV